MASVIRKALVWTALALFAGIGLVVEIAPALSANGHVRAMAQECACIATVEVGRVVSALREADRHCTLRRGPENWLVRPMAVASALGPLMIF